MFKHIFSFISDYPLTGSGFLGCWVMFENAGCSAHNQYGDVLFRTGFFGFIVYIYFLFSILNHLRKKNRDLFFGFLAILIYGVVHETFKLSQGAFILAFLSAMTYNKSLNHLSVKNIN